MATVKTAISLEAGLYERARRAARALGIPRSRLFAIALEELLTQQKNKEFLERLNAACDAGHAVDQPVRAEMRRRHRALVEGTW